MLNGPINRWWTVAAGALGCAGGAGVVATYALGIFVKSISAEFGWDRSYTTAGISCFYIVSGLGSLFLGDAISRWSLRSTTIVFVTLFSLSIMAIGLLPNSLILFCLVFSVMGFFGSAATAMPYAVAVTHQFDRNRGLALALVVSGSGVGALLLPGYANELLQRYGWRVGYFGIGLLVGVVALLGLVFCLRNPQKDVGAAPKNVLRLREIYTSGPTFWLIAAPLFCISIALVGLITNLAPILTDRGASPAEAASIIGLAGAASWVSRLGVGLLLDRIHVRYIAAGIFLTAASGILLFAADAHGPGLYAAAICVGLGIGAEADLLTYSMSRYFAAGSLGRALGAVWIFWAWGNGVGVFLGSLSYDLTGDYNSAMLAFAVLSLLSAGLILRLGPYRFPAHQPAPNGRRKYSTSPDPAPSRTDIHS